MKIEVLHHASVKLTDEKTIYFDPYLISDKTHDADYIFITHDHYDHYDALSIKKGQSGNSEIALFWHQKRTFAQEQGLRYIPGSCVKAFFVWFICFKAQEIHLVISAGVFWVRLRSYLKFLHIFRFVHEESDDIYSCSGLWYRA